MSPSKLDTVYRTMLLTKYFTQGWGNPTDLQRLIGFKQTLSKAGECYKLVPSHYPVNVTNEYLTTNFRVLEGQFTSPWNMFFPEMLPPESKIAYFQMVIPDKWISKKFKPVCLHMAGTGDHFFWRRRWCMARPLVNEGIASVILENPFYGYRKPRSQVRSILRNVSDIFVMGGCLIMESMVIFNWCLRNGLGPLGVTGISMGGHMASLAAASWPYPIVLVPCLSWSTASSAFTEGVMSKSVNWELLKQQLDENEWYRKEISALIHDNSETPSRRRQRPIVGGYFHENPHMVKEYSISNYLIHLLSWLKNDDASVKSYDDVHSFMSKIMNECTHLQNYPVPYDPSLIINVSALYDAYVPRNGVTDLTDLWPGMDVWYIKAGHVTAYLFHQQVFRDAIIEAFNRYQNKYG